LRELERTRELERERERERTRREAELAAERERERERALERERERERAREEEKKRELERLRLEEEEAKRRAAAIERAREEEKQRELERARELERERERELKRKRELEIEREKERGKPSPRSLRWFFLPARVFPLIHSFICFGPVRTERELERERERELISRLPSKHELLLKIQKLDDAIAKSENRRARVQRSLTVHQNALLKASQPPTPAADAAANGAGAAAKPDAEADAHSDEDSDGGAGAGAAHGAAEQSSDDELSDPLSLLLTDGMGDSNKALSNQPTRTPQNLAEQIYLGMCLRSLCHIPPSLCSLFTLRSSRKRAPHSVVAQVTSRLQNSGVCVCRCSAVPRVRRAHPQTR
jgi:hypothetical protein